MDYLMLTFVLLLGLIFGSFLNALIWRLHTGEGMGGRSHCPRCGRQIAWYDNIPIVSFLFLRGKCRHCHQPISWQYPVVELVTGILFTASFILNYELRITNYEFFIYVIRDWFLIAVMTVIFVYDLRWYLILDKVTIPAFAVLLGLNLYLGLDWQNLLFSVIIGGSFFLLQFVVSKGRWIGGGDIRLGALMGVSLGYPGILVAIFIAYILGSIAGIGLIAFGKKQWGSQVPFGTFLAVATVITLFWGSELLSWYWNLLRF